MARFGLPTVLGASAAGAYGMQQLKESGPVGVWSLLPGSSWGSSGSGSSSGEISALQNELRRLTGVVGDVARNGNRPTVVTVGGKSGWSVLIVPAMVGGTVLYVYCRFTGTSVFDLFYVSRSSLTAFRSTVQESMGKMWEELKKSKEEIFKVVSSLGQKQDQMKESQEQLMAKQDQMDDRLRRVDDTCYQLDSKANTTIDRVEKLDNRLQDVHTGVQAANQGIYMLVSAVSEVTQKIGLHNSRTAQALHRYVSNGPAWSNATALPDIATDGPIGSSASMPQLPAPLSLPSGPSLSGQSTGGVATPGGLRGLMSGGGGPPQPVAPTKPMVTEQVKYGAPVDGASCQIEEVADSKVPVPVVAAPLAKPVMASGLSGMFRGF